MPRTETAINNTAVASPHVKRGLNKSAMTVMNGKPVDFFSTFRQTLWRISV
jgi:hypothetical protein